MADDDPDDRLLVVQALDQSGFACDFRAVNDGEQLLAYLRREGSFAVGPPPPFPGLILLDLNMPRMDGRAALRAIRADPRLRLLPVVVFTTSTSPVDVQVSYELGANSYIAKPPGFDGMVTVMKALGDYWLDVVTPPLDRMSS